MSVSVTTNQQINDYYDKYRENEIVFTKDILRHLHLDPRQIYIKCSGNQWPCIINSTSFQQAKIIVGTQGGAFQMITKKEAPPINLRYYFIEPDGNPCMFFVTCKVSDVTPYMNSHELAVVTLSFTQRPPDDLILKLGQLIDANQGFIYRKEERIFINEDTNRLLGLTKKESIVYIQNVPRRCILWNISFSGAKIVILGIPKFLQGKDIVVRLLFSEPDEIIDVKGMIVAATQVENRKDLSEVGIKFDENQIPLAYKIRINNYLSNKNKRYLGASQKTQEADSNEENAAEAEKENLAKKVAAARAANQAANAAADAKRAEEEAAQRAKRLNAQNASENSQEKEQTTSDAVEQSQNNQQ